MTGGHETLEDICELPGNLFEGTLDSFVLALVQVSYKLLDRLLRLVELPATLEQLILLVCKAVILLERFFVDVLVFLQGVIDFLET